MGLKVKTLTFKAKHLGLDFGGLWKWVSLRFSNKWVFSPEYGLLSSLFFWMRQRVASLILGLSPIDIKLTSR
jgi:hypothetical protein